MTPNAALLLLADGRLPAGGYAHSGGFEPTARLQGLNDAAALEDFLEGRVTTSGFVAAAFAAAACAAAHAGNIGRLGQLDPELDARMPSPAVRAVSRALGRQLLRVITRIHPHPVLATLDPHAHQPTVFGAAAASFDLSPQDAALAVLHETITGPASAAVKVLSLDPYEVHSALARLTGLLDELAVRAAAHALDDPDQLPADASPLLDIAAEHHRSWDVRLFAS
ncbi:urease accessory protein UreF [Homoserinimonas sp. OAct 916]|uniref:urease accessory protein UreF n=1 Tax=Homoserinimonas sp. OAct 916 TaxID=2211450 RepID=UPI000DBE0D91|nr:urease accessory UreF family protein [Homoserinimonas sp. OAct 916]